VNPKRNYALTCGLSHRSGDLSKQKNKTTTNTKKMDVSSESSSEQSSYSSIWCAAERSNQGSRWNLHHAQHQQQSSMAMAQTQHQQQQPHHQRKQCGAQQAAARARELQITMMPYREAPLTVWNIAIRLPSHIDVLSQAALGGSSATPTRLVFLKLHCPE
jgi:hypothetical protein